VFGAVLLVVTCIGIHGIFKRYRPTQIIYAVLCAAVLGCSAYGAWYALKRSRDADAIASKWSSDQLIKFRIPLTREDLVAQLRSFYQMYVACGGWLPRCYDWVVSRVSCLHFVFSLGGCGIALAFVEGIILLCEIGYVYAENTIVKSGGRQPRLGAMLKSGGRTSQNDAGTPRPSLGLRMCPCAVGHLQPVCVRVRVRAQWMIERRRRTCKWAFKWMAVTRWFPLSPRRIRNLARRILPRTSLEGRPSPQ
jgi:hypothetical protein